MDHSYSESDISLSPSQILERLQVLRQLQLLQRGKLQKQRLEYQETSENSSSLTEIVSHFSNSTSYNTFRSLLQSPHDTSNEATPRLNASKVSKKVGERDLIEGVSVLNLSQESEFIVNSPVSSRSRVSAQSRNENLSSPGCINAEAKSMAKKQISLDDMPILSPRKDFETLVLEKLQVEKSAPKPKSPQSNSQSKTKTKKPFLRKGEGMSRFGLRKRDLVIQNTKSLPWRKQNLENKNVESPVAKQVKKLPKNKDNKVRIQILVSDSPKSKNTSQSVNLESAAKATTQTTPDISNSISQNSSQSSVKIQDSFVKPLVPKLELPKGKHPLQNAKGKTWASVLTKEQNDFLRQLKQSDYYKNFVSPTKSAVSDASCDETLTELRLQRELAEQNMFDLLEHKVSNESFNLENSFFNRFLRKSKLECSGESTPLVMQQCLANNSDLMRIHPDYKRKRRNDTVQSDVDTCNSEYTDCCSETCSSVSGCCSCRTIEETSNTELKERNKEKIAQKSKEKKQERKEVKESTKETKDDTGTVNENDNLQVNMVEMNSKLIATSELLKDRLRELEDEIETFRQENANLTKMREEIDAERHKFYEEKAMFEQKFNEEKILSEYYLAEEKEKLTKQKQTYEKYVREMRGRLNKKDKDEVVNLKKEINDLKEEIRMKDAKSTSTIARLRNQLKLADKERKDLEEQVEKLKKENRRIQHSNDMTRRMTNIKYLEEINKKLSNITAKEAHSEVILDSNAKYKTFEIERQSRNRKMQQNTNGNQVLRTRAKSVPNLKVTSRYAKYFSQRDVVSDLGRDKTIEVETYASPSDNEDVDDEIINIVQNDSMQYKDSSDHESENNLEKLYMERFHSISPRSSRSNLSNPTTNYNNLQSHNPDTFFISRQNGSSSRDSRSPCNTVSSFNNSNNSNRSTLNRSKSPTLSHRSSDKSPMVISDEINTVRHNSAGNISRNSNIRQSRSPVSILTNKSSSIQKPATVIANGHYKLTSVSPDPSTSKTSLTKTNLNPTEIKKPDGSRELRFPNGNVKFISADGKYSKFVYYNGDVKENFLNEGRVKYFYAETKTYHTTHADGLEVLEFPDGQVEKRYKDGSTEIRLPNGSVRYFDPKNEHVREEWRFPDGAALTISASGEQRIVFSNGQVEVHAKDHKRREFPDGTVKLVYTDGTAETRYSSGRVRIKDKHGNLIMDSAPA